MTCSSRSTRSFADALGGVLVALVALSLGLLFGGITRCDEVARGILEALDRLNMSYPIVVRLDGTNAEEGRAILADAGHEVLSTGDEPVDGDEWAETPEIVLYSGAMNRVAVKDTLEQFEKRDGVRLTTVRNSATDLKDAMEAGKIDLAIGLLPQLKAGFFQRRERVKFSRLAVAEVEGLKCVK